MENEDVEIELNRTMSKDAAAYGATGCIVTPQFAMGTTGQGANSLVYLENQLMYPVGVLCVMHNPKNNEMTFVHGHEKVRNIVGVALTPNRKYVACTEDVEDSESQQVSVYSLQTGKRIRTLTTDPTQVLSNKVTCMSFSENSKYLLVQHNAPDHALIIWRWYSGKMLCCMTNSLPLLKSAFSASNSVMLATLASNSCHLHRLDVESGNVRTMQVANVSDYGKEQYSGMCWLVGNFLAMITSQGRVQVNQDNQVLGTMLTEEGDYLTCITPRLRGFVVSGMRGVLYFFDPPDPDKASKKSSNRDVYILAKKVPLEFPGSLLVTKLLAPPTSGVEFLPRNAALDVAVGGGDDMLAILTAGGEILTLDLAIVHDEGNDKKEEYTGQEQEEDQKGPFQMLSGGFSSASIVTMDALNFPPLLVTGSSDRMVRMYNYQARKSILAQCLEEEVLSCSLHPSGSQLLVGMHDKLRLFNVALDELTMRAEFAVKKCNLAKYSNGGAVFAAVGRTNVIVVHHAYSLQQLGQLKGHVSAVTSLQYSSDDRVLVSTGAGGAVYFWDLTKFTRIIDMEHVDKRLIFSSSAFLTRNVGAIVRTHDGRIQHVQDGRVEYEVEGCKGGQIAPLALLGDDAVLLAATDKGSVKSIPWPTDFPLPAGESKQLSAQDAGGSEYRLHARTSWGMTAMILIHNKGLLFTANSDGTVLVSQVAMVIQGELLEAAENSNAPSIHYVTIAEERLQAMNAKRNELMAMLATVRSDCEYQAMRQSQALRDVISKLEAELSDVSQKLEISQMEVTDLVAGAQTKERNLVKELESAHMAAAEELENMYEKRLAFEAERLKHMVNSKDDMQFRNEERIVKLKASHHEEMQAMSEQYEIRIKELTVALSEVKFQNEHMGQFYNEMVMQTEVDFDENTDRLEKKMDEATSEGAYREEKLKVENHLFKRSNLRLKGDLAIEKKKMDRLLRDNTTLRDNISGQQETIRKLKEEMEERDAVMSENYATIQHLRGMIQDLEKHKYVLGYKVESYQNELIPKAQQAAKLAAEAVAHDKELAAELATIKDLRKEISDKDRYIRSLKTEINDIKVTMRRQQERLRLFSFDVSNVMQASDDRKEGENKKSQRQALLEGLYKKYAMGEGGKSNHQVEQELTRHLHMSELRSVIMEHRLEDAIKLSQQSQRVAVHENVQLLQELQVSQHDGKEVSRKLDLAIAELKELQARYRILEARSKDGAQGGTSSGLGPDEDSSNSRVHSSSLASGSRSLAGRVPPSRPTSAAYPLNRSSWAASGTGGGGGSSRGTRPPSAAAAYSSGGGSSSATRSRDRPMSASPVSYRSNGAIASGSMARGSPTCMLHELIGNERDRVTELMTQLQATAEELEKQRVAAFAASNALRIASAGGGGGFGGGETLYEVDEEEEEEELGEGANGIATTTNSGQNSGAAQAADILRRRGLTNNEAAKTRPNSAYMGSNKNSSGGPIAFSAPVRRRPTSAAGMGMRAYINGNLKNWRELS